MKPCNCNYAESGRCFLKADNDWRDKNMDHYFKWMDGKHQLGFVALGQEESMRLRQKEYDMRRMGIEDTRLVDCEIGTLPFTKGISE